MEEEIMNDDKESFCTGSRLKLFAIWLPVQIVSIAIVGFMTSQIFKVPRGDVQVHSASLL